MLTWTREIFWKLLLQLKNRVRLSEHPVQTVTVLCHEEDFEITINPSGPLPADKRLIVFTREALSPGDTQMTIFRLEQDDDITLKHNALLDETQLRFLSLYLPFCFWTLKAQAQKRARVVIHFAQTLDGRIATIAGSSKWISNREDLVHAHRMRALCDAVLIGANTLVTDKPALTVRHVEGPNPVRVVVGNSSYDFSSLLANEGRVIFISGRKPENPGRIECILLSNGLPYISPCSIIQELYRKNIHSIYIEGGSVTASFFLSDQCVDILQLFVSPRILGSGVSNFNLPSVNAINDSLVFGHSSFTGMGEGILFQGKLVYGEKS